MIQVADGGLEGEMTASQARIARVMKIVEEEKIMGLPEFARIPIDGEAKRKTFMKLVAYVERIYGLG